MGRNWRTLLLVLLFVGQFARPVNSRLCPSGDLDGNCVVDSNDLKLFSTQWLDSGGCLFSNCADFDGANGVNLSDYSVLANNWRKAGIALVINEFMASNSSNTGIHDPQGDYDDWIEIHNFGTTALDLGGMYLTDDLNDPDRWQIPSGHPDETNVAPGGYILVWADGEPCDGLLHADFKLSAAEGESIGLFGSDGSTLIDSVTFGPQTTDLSYGRYPDGNDNFRFFAIPTPLADNNGAYLGQVSDLQFSHERGFHHSSFDLTIVCSTEGAEIHYTLDGSEPTNNDEPSPGSSRYVSAIPISTTTCLRATAIKPGWKSCDVFTHTYIFVDDVITQSPSGEVPTPDWPPPTTGPGQCIDYGMDPDVVCDVRYEALIDDALLSIPSISLVTALDNLFDPATGIYMNALMEGPEWERPASAELIHPDGADGFQIDAGLRIRGGWSRYDDCPKHAFRLFFRSRYGHARLTYPLFGDEGAAEFDKIDLRTAQNYSWSFYGDARNTFLRDVFSRDLQRETRRPYTRSRFYHLFINGQYWGLYQTQERPEAHYAATYFGGSESDYDVVKADGGPTGSKKAIATDGNLDAYRELWDLANQLDDASGQDKTVLYQRMQGNNPDGSRNPDYQVLPDIDNLIDYMLCTYYVGDKDSPISNFFGNDELNNFFGVFNRVNSDGFKFFRHDAEHSLDTGMSDRTGPYTVINEKLNPDYFNPQTLHQWLMEHPDYRMRFADRAYKHMFTDGPMTQAAAVAAVSARANQIDLAIIAESARWGDAKHASWAHTKDNDWLPAVSILNCFFSGRVSTVLDQFRNKGWYPNIDPPTFNQQGGHVAAGFGLTMTNPNGSGDIYYTLDGSDPRQPVTGNPVGTLYTGAVTLNLSRHVKARVLSSGEWSALNEAAFAVGPVADNLRITEIMYHPADTNDPNDPNKEFIELKNIGPETINVNLVRFANGIDFTFGSLSLSSGQYVVVVKDVLAFVSRYPGFAGIIAGQYSGSLNNGGERIELEDAIGQTILDFTYKDGWRAITDGDGYSLTIINPDAADTNGWGEEDSWRPSAYVGGSPGEDDSGIVPNPGAVVISEVMSHSHGGDPDWIELYNTTGGAIDLSGWFLSDSDSNVMKYEIAAGTTIGAGQYLVFYEDVNFGDQNDAGCILPFALSENGEKVCLSSYLDGNNNLTGYRQVEDFGASESDVSFGRYYKASTD
ncbi:MAG TPA: lamin tail domain-containing protein, partial [Sedimentisphaerales bacterium]|nr:lamin tail domain-containing protein [Sedimentisphaerales bacterium]